MTNPLSNIASKATLVFIIIFIFSAPLLAKREHPEKWYQHKWCEALKGQAKVALPLRFCWRESVVGSYIKYQ
jgi:hypothetical protein